jgi:outer membrane biosynthesis protein TonB
MPARFTQFGFGLMVVAGLAMAALAAGCSARQQTGPEDPALTDPEKAEVVEPDQPMGDGGVATSPSPSRPQPPPPEPQPPPRPSPRDPLPDPSPLPTPVPEPNPTPPGG